MNCEHFEELVSARLDGELTTTEEQTLDDHLIQCHKCREFAAAMVKVEQEVNGRQPVSISSGLEHKILSQSTQSISTPAFQTYISEGYYRIPRPIAWAVVAALLILTIQTVFQPVSFKTTSPALNDFPETKPKTQEVVFSSMDVVQIDDTRIQRIAMSGKDIVTSYTKSTNPENY